MSFNVFNHRGGYQIKNWGVKQALYDVLLYFCGVFFGDLLKNIIQYNLTGKSVMHLSFLQHIFSASVGISLHFPHTHTSLEKPLQAEDDTLLKMSWTRLGCFSAILRHSCRNFSNSILAISSYNITLDEKIHFPCTKQHNSKLNIALHMLKFWHKNIQLILKNKLQQWVNILYSKQTLEYYCFT